MSIPFHYFPHFIDMRNEHITQNLGEGFLIHVTIITSVFYKGIRGFIIKFLYFIVEKDTLLNNFS